MRVGVYFNGFPKETGGGYTFEQEILQSLSKLTNETSHELFFYCGGETNSDVFISNESPDTKIKVRSIATTPQRFKLVRKIYNRLRRELGVIIKTPPSALDEIAHQEKIDLLWSVSFILPSVNVPYIATVLDIQHRLQPWFPEVGHLDVWHRREVYNSTYLKRAAYILTPNIVGQQELSLFYGIPAERFRLLPHPSPHIESIPDQEVVNRVLEKYHLDGGYLLYPAQFWSHKNHANLLLALQVLKNKHGQKKHLVLLGSDQGNLEYIRNLTSTLELEDQVHFLGFVPRDDLIALYCGAFALTYVSLFGPENLPPLEAFKCGCPVIVSDYSGARHQLGDAALFVNGLDPDVIAQTIQKMEYESEFRLDLIERGRKRANLYSVENYVHDVFKIFDEFESVRRNWGSD